jgi:hypothetical protein
MTLAVRKLACLLFLTQGKSDREAAAAYTKPK